MTIFKTTELYVLYITNEYDTTRPYKKQIYTSKEEAEEALVPLLLDDPNLAYAIRTVEQFIDDFGNARYEEGYRTCNDADYGEFSGD